MATATAGALEGTYSVVTPEYVEFRFVLAGLYSRFLAMLVDAVIVTFGSGFVMTLLALALPIFPGFASALGFIVLFVFDWGYAILLETAWSGQTVGKRLFGIRTIQESGVRVGFTQAALRNLVRPVDRLPVFYLVGGAAALFSASHQRLGDLLAGTIVVRDRRLKIPASLARSPEEMALVQDAAFASRLNALTSEEQELLVSAALRREELSMEARLSLFAGLAARLVDLGFFKPGHLSDEKLVLVVVAALAKRAADRAARPQKARAR